jgi:hypothetical protein
MSDDEVEEMEVEEEEERKPTRRVPRRAVSTDGGTGAGKKPMRRAASTDGSKPVGSGIRRTNTAGGTKPGGSNLGRNNTESASAASPRVGRRPVNKDRLSPTNDTDESNANTQKGVGASENVVARRARTVPGRSKSSDGFSKPLASRTKSGTSGPTRGTPKRMASALGRVTPRRTKSSDGQTNAFGGMRRGRKKGGVVLSDGTMNIFGNDLVSTERIMEDIAKAKTEQEYIRLELEDFFMADREDYETLPLALKDLVEGDDRPWEGVDFVDDILDGSSFHDFKERKKFFMKTFAGVCEARLIPCSFKAKITISNDTLDMEEMVELLFFLRSEKSVTELTLKSDEVDESIIRGLTELFKSDRRKWSQVTLQLSGSGPGKPATPEHTAWAKAMQAATVEMQKVAKERGINLG